MMMMKKNRINTKQTFEAQENERIKKNVHVLAHTRTRVRNSLRAHTQETTREKKNSERTRSELSTHTHTAHLYK